MVNFYERVLLNPSYYRQFNCSDSLITVFNCPLEARLMKSRFADLWTHYNYLFYVIDGRKIWHTAHQAYDIGKETCVFVRKGAWIFENFLDNGFCVVLFFIPDDFICKTLKARSRPLQTTTRHIPPVMILDKSDTLSAFFLSISSYFSEAHEPDSSLLELKFKELILTIAGNPNNAELVSYFCSLLDEPQHVSLQRVMDENYCFNLKLEEYAQLSNRSLSTFKRDFQKVYKTAPGKWLLEQRLNHAVRLLRERHKTISEATFESGFESVSHFSRSFKERFGVTPSAFRQEGSLHS
ncbi:helix-turn-helix transcriptional regulator [Chryseolinea lacunae]|uniref:Helix-turn-helix transcriptional regulator n=1 Tax=Chryseolinea lacunae TaxID=2801331 RepID=A0ABS1L0K4_9BACT|nr:AraC family transcriptional regulator [Chryseolinea lacunae]MBL0745231.1 helix-turn-helix transcriptional regulator [Chryseolinea lacunae]